ncbi:hypothetical protein O7627_25730 [Solwaraspora sp. WMMD1047]|uniref:hypothetical protein n=1 Tax=Solwaraspora sp. WMMD1047 TaxID=3016102 RepID=UPI00241598E3|nr:hypothetical protein [Solwaraspora sp. WMMD1047]MDG4832683.1 hypothetical protein [Solwaraspora sp. WMMD1047]
MRPAVAYEWRRLRTLRSTWWLFGVSLVVTALLGLAFAALVLDLRADPGQAVSSSETFILVLTRSVLTPVAAGLIGVFAIGHDLRYGTVTTTLLVTPRRSVALAAKALVVAGATAAMAVANLAVAWTVALAVLSGRIPMDLSPFHLVRAQAGFVLLVVGWALIGLALGLLLPSQPAAILALVVTPFIIEPIFRLFLGSSSFGPVREAAQFLPFAAGDAMLSGADASASAVLGESMSGAGPLVGGATFLLFVAILSWGGVASFRQRDV